MWIITKNIMQFDVFMKTAKSIRFIWGPENE